jgi:hypothetical protein
VEALAGSREDRFGALAVLATAAVAFAIRVAVLLAVGFHPEFFDADEYHRMAVDALRGHPMDTVGHPPGYSWFLVAVYDLAGTKPRIVYLVQATLSAFAVLLVADAARRRWGPRAALVTGLLLAFDTHAALFPSALVSENLCLAGIAAITWLVAPSLPRLAVWRLVAAVVVAGSLTHVRTGFVVLVPVLAFLPLALEGRSGFRAARPWAAAALAALAGGLVVAAFPLFRAHETGSPPRLGSPMDSLMLWMGNNPAATGRYEEMPGRPAVGQPGIPDVDALARVSGERARAFLVERPWRQPELVLRRASHLVSPPKRDLIYLYGHGWAGEKSPAAVAAVLAGLVLSFAALVAAALAGFVKRGDDVAFRFGAAIVLLVALPYLGSVGDARYMHPAHAAAAFLAGACVATRAGPPSPRRKALACAFGAALLLNGSWDVSASLPAMRAVASPGGSALRPPYHFAR